MLVEFIFFMFVLSVSSIVDVCLTVRSVADFSSGSLCRGEVSLGFEEGRIPGERICVEVT